MSCSPLWEKKNPLRKRKKERKKETQDPDGTGHAELACLSAAVLHVWTPVRESQNGRFQLRGSVSGATFTPSGRNTLMSIGADFFGLVLCFYLLPSPTPRLGTKLVCCLHPSPWATGTASIFGPRFPIAWWVDGYIQWRSYMGALSISHGPVIWFLCFDFNDLFLLHLRNRYYSFTLSVVCLLNLFYLL